MARARKKDRPAIICRVEGGKLCPVTPYDLELLEDLPHGKDMEVTCKQPRRSHPQLRAYWAGLRRIVQSTDKYPDEVHLHRALKTTLGYVEQTIDLYGRVSIQADSIALDEMEPSEFNTYLNRAERACLEAFGMPIMDQEYRRVA